MHPLHLICQIIFICDRGVVAALVVFKSLSKHYYSQYALHAHLAKIFNKMIENI